MQPVQNACEALQCLEGDHLHLQSKRHGPMRMATAAMLARVVLLPACGAHDGGPNSSFQADQESGDWREGLGQQVSHCWSIDPSARRAVMNSPLQVPKSLPYETWKHITFTFNPEEMLGQ